MGNVRIDEYGIVSASGIVNPNKLLLFPKAYDPTAYNAYQINMDTNMVANKTYTIQFWNVNVSHTGKTVSGLGISVYWGGGNISLVNMLGTAYFTHGHADHLTATFTITSSQASGSGASNAWLCIYNSIPNADGTRSLTIEKWKLEEGSVPTPWIPNTSDAIYVDNNQGFIEHITNDRSRINQEGYVQSNNFIEW